jgi:hypothetical protein
VAAAIVDVVRRLYRAGADVLAAQQEMPTAALAAILQDCIREADQATVDNAMYLGLMGFPAHRCTAGELWHHLVERMMADDAQHVQHWQAPLQTILQQGPLARRLLRATGGEPSRARLQTVWRELSECLQSGKMFTL